MSGTKSRGSKPISSSNGLTVPTGQSALWPSWIRRAHKPVPDRRLDVPLGEILLEVLVQRLELDLGERVQRAKGWRGVGLERNAVVVRSVWRKHAGRLLAEYVGKVGVLG